MSIYCVYMMSSWLVDHFGYDLLFFQLSTTNFKDDVSLMRLLGCINSTFQELKHHEEIENTCIMTVLQHRLINEQIQAIVRDVHKDNHVLEILSLTKKGLKCASKNRTNLNRNTFEDRLKGALESFQKDFLPHMRHEEEVISFENICRCNADCENTIT